MNVPIPIPTRQSLPTRSHPTSLELGTYIPFLHFSSYASFRDGSSSDILILLTTPLHKPFPLHCFLLGSELQFRRGTWTEIIVTAKALLSQECPRIQGMTQAGSRRHSESGIGIQNARYSSMWRSSIRPPVRWRLQWAGLKLRYLLVLVSFPVEYATKGTRSRRP